MKFNTVHGHMNAFHLHKNV